MKPRVTGNPVGRPRIEVSRDILMSMYNDYNSWPLVAKELGMSKKTIYRRLNELNMVCAPLYKSFHR